MLPFQAVLEPKLRRWRRQSGPTAAGRAEIAADSGNLRILEIQSDRLLGAGYRAVEGTRGGEGRTVSVKRDRSTSCGPPRTATGRPIRFPITHDSSDYRLLSSPIPHIPASPAERRPSEPIAVDPKIPGVYRPCKPPCRNRPTSLRCKLLRSIVVFEPRSAGLPSPSKATPGAVSGPSGPMLHDNLGTPFRHTPARSCAPLQPGEPGGATLARQQLGAVAADHGGRLPAPGMEDRRHLDAGADHVLGRADPRAVPRQAVDHIGGQSRRARHRLEDARHLAGRQGREDQEATVVKLGVLIVGSLYWDLKPPRPRWRAERLDSAHQEHVRVPIRYGRRSSTRRDSYTMVVSTALAADELGTAIAVPCHSCDLVEEAEELWAAEDNSNDGGEGRISAGFGCVALLENPDCPLPDKLRMGWTDRVGREVNYKTPMRMHGEDRDVVDPCSGFLKIDWPLTVAGPRCLSPRPAPRGPSGLLVSTPHHRWWPMPGAFRKTTTRGAAEQWTTSGTTRKTGLRPIRTPRSRLG